MGNHGKRFVPPTTLTRRYQPTRHLAEGKQAGAQILTHHLAPRLSRSGAGVWGAVALHEGEGFRRDAPSALRPPEARQGARRF